MEAKDGIAEYNLFVARHKLQLERSSVPEKFWFPLHKKLEKGIFDAGEAFCLFKIDYDGDKEDTDPLYTVMVSKEEGINCDDGHEIYLVDHAWTYTHNQAITDLNQIPGLLTRMCNMMGIDSELSYPEKSKKVWNEMWRYNQTYSYGFGDPENRIPMWYIMDEFGSAIQHSDNPNFRAVPFYYTQDQISYTILFPVRNVGFNETVTRNYLEGSLRSDELVNQVLLNPWKPCYLSDIDYSQPEPDKGYFLYGHLEETLPENEIAIDCLQSEPLKVYSEYSVLTENLTHPSFEVVTNENDADILWFTEHFKKYKDLNESNPGKYINQFPFEHVLTVKDLLSIVCRRKRRDGVAELSDNPVWCPTTYNLATELPKFFSYYQAREKNNLDNHWICKPWNLARGLDIVITDNLNCILRLPSTGPKIAQKYVDSPVLFNRPEIGWVKFDIRYMVLLKSVTPLKGYAYRNFFVRFANKPYDLNDLWDGEKHFTVMNYNPVANLYKMLPTDFIPEFNRQNPSEDWSEMEKDIFEVLKQVLEAATMKPPPCGVAHYSKSRAMYAVDLILSRDGSRIQPKILEFNWNPDCRRACEYYPSFFNDVFLLLFKDEENDALFIEL